VSNPQQGEIWWASWDDRRRPVLVLTRDAAIPLLNRVLVAPVTRTVRGIPTELPLDEADGLREPCAASFDNLQLLPRHELTERQATLGPDRWMQICAAYRAVTDC